MAGMDPAVAQGPLSLIASAVTPAVLISATAILLNGVASKHSNMSNRIRGIAAEFRDPQTSPSRRENILAQVSWMNRRVTHIRRSHIVLYAAIACFVVMILVLTLTQVHKDWLLVTVPLFLGGVGLLLFGVISELLELRLAARTLGIELTGTFGKGEWTSKRSM